ncbi:Protein RETICULATA-RELATED 3, chloroplastic [Coccomyxa sp. Obi]|nr:Protein RETICULATA-RELATED 3, chloroplastic [Coccomyxa sp. Obi]
MASNSLIRGPASVPGVRPAPSISRQGINIQKPFLQRGCQGKRHSRKPSFTVRVSTTGGVGGSIGGGGAKGFGGDDEAGDGSEEPEKEGILLRWKGWRERVAADPSFPYKVFIEQIIGVGAAVVGDMSSRPYWGLYELDFVFSTLVVGSIVNFSLMYFLAPTAGASVGATNLLQKLFSEQTLLAMGAPGGHMFQPGAFPLTKRLLNLGYKGLVFAVVGFAAGIVGTATSNGLLAVRKQLDKNFVSQNQAPNVLLNAGTWATHMGVSSNVRYQILNGIDMVMQPRLGPGSFKVLTSLLRTANNILGGISFVVLAKVFGVQSSAGDQKKSSAKASSAPVAALKK